LELAIGEKDEKNMNNKTIYENAPKEIADAIEQSEIIADFLPSPDQLVIKEDTVKVTLNLNRNSVQFIKEKARENGVAYQTMIRRIVDLYADHYR
jgi:predicted DNA binding CopG/RHH family protein